MTGLFPATERVDFPARRITRKAGAICAVLLLGSLMVACGGNAVPPGSTNVAYGTKAGNATSPAKPANSTNTAAKNTGSGSTAGTSASKTPTSANTGANTGSSTGSSTGQTGTKPGSTNSTTSGNPPVNPAATVPANPSANPAIKPGEARKSASIPFVAIPAETLMGLSENAIKAKIGAPELIRAEGPTRVWQYRSEKCSFDAFFYPGTEGETRKMTHMLARPRKGGGKVSVQECLDQVMRARPRRG